jgi:hypothetical protein
MAVTTRVDADLTSLAFLTLVERDPATPGGYQGGDVHLVTNVQFEGYSVEPGRVAADQILIHIVTRGGRRVATLSMNEPAVRAMTSGLCKAAGLIGSRRERRPTTKDRCAHPFLELLEDSGPPPSETSRVAQFESDIVPPGCRQPAGARKAPMWTTPRWLSGGSR